MKSSDVNGPVFFATVPTPATRRWRTFLPYQFLRFVFINLKMIRMLAKAHGNHKAPN